jgi:hypothetical protein
MKNLYIQALKHLLRLDGPTLVSDSKLTRIIKRKILKPLGYYFRKKHFDIVYPELSLKNK